MAQISVIKIKEISIAANKLFFNPNCKGVKARLKKMLNIKGKATIQVIRFCANKTKTWLKEIIIKRYKKLQAGPNSQAGGAHDGLINCEYQL